MTQIEPTKNYQEVKVEIPLNKKIQKGLLVTSVACAALSLVPPVRIAFAIALRAVTFLSNGASLADSWKNQSVVEKATKCAQMAGIILCIAALAASIPVLAIASIAMDLAIQTFEMSKAFYNQEGSKGLAHLAIVVIETLVLSAMITGSMELMFIATIVSAVAIFTFILITASQKRRDEDVIDQICYVSLATISLFSNFLISGSSYNKYTKSRFIVTNNNKDGQLICLDKNGNKVATIDPERTLDFTIDHNKTIEVQQADNSYRCCVNVINVQNGQSYSESSIQCLSSKVVLRPALPPELFATVPIGGQALILPQASNLGYIPKYMKVEVPTPIAPIRREDIENEMIDLDLYNKRLVTS